MQIVIIDNYDSFVYNIAQYLGELGVECDVIRNDKITIDQIKNVRLIRTFLNLVDLNSDVVPQDGLEPSRA